MTQKVILRIVFACLFGFLYVKCFAFVVRGHEPQNIGKVTQDAFKYYDTGEYLHDVTLVDKQAIAYLKMRLSDCKVKKDLKHYAVVFDIDETLYSNAKLSRVISNVGALSFPVLTSGNDYVMKYSKDFSPEVLKPTQKVFQFAKQHGLSIFIITGNREKLRPIVEKRLKEKKYAGWTQLVLQPNNLKVKKTADFKSNARKKIEKSGYHILVNIGDQESDLAGGYSEVGFKLPNPFYFLP